MLFERREGQHLRFLDLTVRRHPANHCLDPHILGFQAGQFHKRDAETGRVSVV